MIAYKFLRHGAVGPFSGLVWPVGEWVSGGGHRDPCASGIHACRAGDLPVWLCDELWVAELAGSITEARSKVVAWRGRLLRRVDDWNAETSAELRDACARRARQHADLVPGDDAARAEAAEGYASDAAMMAERGAAAASVAYIAVRAAINASGGPAGAVAERAWQARWILENLSLHA